MYYPQNISVPGNQYKEIGIDNNDWFSWDTVVYSTVLIITVEDESK